jgi:AcrR family transcriptional regulator
MPLQTFFNLPETKRQAFLECALDEYAAADYKSASISRIVARAGIPKGSFYQYFADKNDLYLYLLELAAQKKSELLAAAQPPDPELPLFATLRWLFTEMARYELLYPRLAKIAYRAAYNGSGLPEKLRVQGREATAVYFRGLIQKAKTRGEVCPDVDEAAAAYIFTSILSEMGGYLAAQAGIDPAHIGIAGAYPVDTPAVRTAFDALLTVLECGIGVKRN